jgi:transcriptional regulator with XRE-family HTH domain
MNQPELGKKIAELRKAKGLTQEELVEKCNINVRTLQRIESGEVMPRSYTIKIIFAALEYDVYDSTEIENDRFSKSGFVIKERLKRFYIYFIDLFNLKTNKMKKLTVLTVVFVIIFIGIFAVYTKSNAQKAEKVIRTIEGLQTKGNEWINKGMIDSVLTLYRADATVFPAFSGKAEIREMMQSAVDGGYKLIDFKTLSVSVGDSIAVQKYYDVFEFNGTTFKQKGITEWRLTNGKWLVVNDIMNNY